MGMNVNGMCPKFKLMLNGYVHVFLLVQIGMATDLYFLIFIRQVTVSSMCCYTVYIQRLDWCLCTRFHEKIKLSVPTHVSPPTLPQY